MVSVNRESGPSNVHLELGLDHGDGLRDLGIFLDEDNVGAGGLDGAALFAADDRVGNQGVELLRMPGSSSGSVSS